MTVFSVFRRCVEAIREGHLIERESDKDKEFHFQNWVTSRLVETGFKFEVGGRNSYPDFRMVETTEGYELKGLAYPGRYVDFDSNSQVPTGSHNGRTIYYIFGRYPKKPDGSSFPILDLVFCHGDFLNADRDYSHRNDHVKGFGSYGDILIRDRKMYVVPTPFRLAEGISHSLTLILPAEVVPDEGYIRVGALSRREAESLVIGYSFDLRTNELIPETVPNPGAGREHTFQAWRLAGSPEAPVVMRPVSPDAVVPESEAGAAEDSTCG